MEGFDVVLEGGLRVAFEVEGLSEVGLVEGQLGVWVGKRVGQLGEVGHRRRNITHLSIQY